MDSNQRRPFRNQEFYRLLQLPLCDSYLSATYNNLRRSAPSIEQRLKTSKSLSTFNSQTKKPKSRKPHQLFSKIQFTTCELCKGSFYVKHHKNIRTHICQECKPLDYCLVNTNTCQCCGLDFISERPKKYCEQCSPNIRHYRTRATFKFNVYLYPSEFNLSLIEKHGWYSPNGYGRKNSEPNLKGASRDHLFSVKDGFEQNIDPKILAHPANCQIMIHNGQHGNNKKNCSSSITLEELLYRIDEWDKKYSSN